MNDEPGQQKPYERYGCQGRYMEPGTAWEQIPGLCSRDCDVRHTCWSMKNGSTTTDTGAQGRGRETAATPASDGASNERADA